MQTLGTDGPLGPGVQCGSVAPGYLSGQGGGMCIFGSVVLSVAQRIGGLCWKAEVAGTDEQEKEGDLSAQPREGQTVRFHTR